MIIDELKKANIQAMKDHNADARAVLGIVMSKYKLQEVELKAAGKDIGDTECLSIIQKTLKELDDELKGYINAGRSDSATSTQAQIDTIKVYLPKQLSEEEIRAEIAKLDDKSMPSIMKHFKANFAGKVDMSLVSQIARSL